MLGNEASAADPRVLAASNARTSSAGGSWIDVRDIEGDILVLLNCGPVSGTTPTLDVKIKDATSSGGAGSADVANAAFTQITTSNNMQKLVIPAGSVRGWISADWTIGGTTPSFNFAVLAAGRPKTV